MKGYSKDQMSNESSVDRSNDVFPFTETLWDFSLRYYQLAGIEPACLSVQNEYSGNVLLILWNKWLDHQKCHIDEAYHKELSMAVDQQCSMTLAPLRLARKGLKDTSMLNAVQKTQQKHSILSIELRIEQEIMMYLHDRTDWYVRGLAETSSNVRSLYEAQYLYRYLMSIRAKQALCDVLLVPV